MQKKKKNWSTFEVSPQSNPEIILYDAVDQMNSWDII